MNVVIIVIVPTIGRMKELVTPISVPPLATTNANSPPEEANPKPVLSAVNCTESLCPCRYKDSKEFCHQGYHYQYNNRNYENRQKSDVH